MKLKFIGGIPEGPVNVLPLIESFMNKFEIGKVYELDRDLHQCLPHGPQIVLNVNGRGVPARKDWFEEVEESND